MIPKEYRKYPEINGNHIKEGLCKETQKAFLNETALYDTFLREALNQFRITEKEADADWETFLVWLVVELTKKNHQLWDQLITAYQSRITPMELGP